MPAPDFYLKEMEKEKIKYKYGLNQRVRFRTVEYKDILCKCCGSVIDHKAVEKIKSGKIVDRKFLFTIKKQRKSSIEDDVKISSSGRVMHKPYLSSISLNKDEPWYYIETKDEIEEVNEDDVIEII